MWEQLKRIIKPKGAIVLFGSQPFTSALVMSNPKWFKYAWVWDKVSGVGFQSVRFRPMKNNEDVCLFASGQTTYNPQMSEGKPYSRPRSIGGGYMGNDVAKKFSGWLTKSDGKRYPKTIVKFSNASQVGKFHPTQKPVALLEYLIKTYTNEGETVLDFTFGSGTTGVACVNLNRNFIGIEQDSGYFEIATKRIAETINTPKQLELIA